MVRPDVFSRPETQPFEVSFGGFKFMTISI